MSKSNKAKRNWQSANMNANQLEHYRTILRNLAVSCYKWENLPLEIDERYLEMTLYYNALSLFFYDDDYEHFFTQEATPKGQINMTRNPVAFEAYGANGYHKSLKWSSNNAITQCVPIWANYSRWPYQNTLEIYAKRLANIDRTIDVNLNGCKQPMVVVCPEEQKLTMQNFMKQYDGNEPFIMGYQGLFDGSQFAVLNTQVDYKVDKLLADKARIWNEICTFLGIDNSNQDKKERLVEDEVSANNGQIEMFRLSNLNARRQACAAINDAWGLNVSVNFNMDYLTSNHDFANSIVMQQNDGDKAGAIE